MTFSIVGRCERTGMVGVAITTSSICVGARCPWARARVGAVATQNVTLPSIGLLVLDRIERGADAQAALDAVMAGPVDAEYRQVTVIDHRGRGAHFTGARTLGTNAVATGTGASAPAICCGRGGPGGDGRGVPGGARAAPRGPAVERARSGPRPRRGGAVHSAALLVADEQPWPLVDLRVDWDERDPIASCATSGPTTSRRCRTTSRARSTPHPLRPTACRAIHERAEAAAAPCPAAPRASRGADGPDRDSGRPGLSADQGADPDRRHPPIVVDLVPPKMVERRRVIPLGRID